MDKLPLSGVLTALIRDAIPKGLEEFHRAEASAAQTSMWLVGLASSALLFCAANPGKAILVFDGYNALGVACLMATVFCGIVSRLLQLVLAKNVTELTLKLHGHLMGASRVGEIEEPDELDEAWDRSEIVARLKSHFSVAWEFLTEYDVPLAKCQQCYSDAYANWKHWEERRLQELQRIMGAHLGVSDRSIEKVMAAATEDHLTWTKARAWWTRLLAYLCNGLFVAAAVAFLTAVSLVARSLWIQGALGST